MMVPSPFADEKSRLIEEGIRSEERLSLRRVSLISPARFNSNTA